MKNPSHSTTENRKTKGAPLSNSLDRYCREIAQTPLLTREEEVALARRIQKGDEVAREQMIKSNLRLVVKIANDYARFGLPIEDLISEGNIGLMTAAERYDPSYGAKFSTYAAWWIKQCIKRALGNQSRTIRLPLHVTDQLRAFDRGARELGEELGREPGDAELARHVGVPKKKLVAFREAAQTPTSLDAPAVADDPEGNSIGSIVPDENVEPPSEKMTREELKALLRPALRNLAPREQEIVVSRFGLDGKAPKTLEELGELFGVTRERIRQIQAAAIEKLSIVFGRLDRQVPGVVSHFPQPPTPNPVAEAVPA